MSMLVNCNNAESTENPLTWCLRVCAGQEIGQRILLAGICALLSKLAKALPKRVVLLLGNRSGLPSILQRFTHIRPRSHQHDMLR